MKDRTIKRISFGVFFILCVLFIIKFSGASILKLYIQTGVGDCQKLPILCAAPQAETQDYQPDQDYLSSLKSYLLPEVRLSVPKEFTVIKGHVSKAFYKKLNPQYSANVIYVLRQNPDFFIQLFPQVARQGVKDDHDFVSRTMQAKLPAVKNLTDAFFVIMKTIFTPNLGEQKNLRIVAFTLLGKKGFITYNLGAKENYFNCDIFDEKRVYIKLYIKDKYAILDLEKVMAIVSSVEDTA